MVLQPAPHPGPGEIPGQPGTPGPDAGQAAAGGLAAVYREGVDSVSERLVAPGVEIYAVAGDSVGVNVGAHLRVRPRGRTHGSAPTRNHRGTCGRRTPISFKKGSQMAEQTLNLHTLANRLERVEKQNRRLKFMGILLLALGIIMGSLEIAMSSNTPLYTPLFRAKMIVAEEINIVDKDSNIVAKLGIKDKTSTIIGGQKVVDPGGVTLLLSDKSNNSRISIGFGLGVASIMLYDENSKTGNAETIAMLTVSGGQPLLSFVKNGQTIWQAPPRQ